MKGPIVVFTATNQYGGIDVNYASCCRQTLAKRIVWLVADDLLHERLPVWEDLASRDDLADVIAFRVAGKYGRSLSSSYRAGMRMARGMHAELFVSLQDYFWVPPDGVERFVEGAKIYPDALLTGLASIADNPTPDKVVDPTGRFTVFAQPFMGKPEESYSWEEVRGKDETGWYEANQVEWEMNWAAIPRNVLNLDVDFDTEFDRGIAYENQDYAFQLLAKHHTPVMTDANNRVIGLPHKEYFPEHTQYQGSIVPRNRLLLSQKWETA